MSIYKRKRGAGPSQGVMSVYVKPTSYKRRRADGPYYSPGRPGPTIRMRRGYTTRTPGGQITAENHYFDADRTSLTVPSSGASWAGCEVDPLTLLSLFAPIQGDDIANRQGRKVFVKSIRITGRVQVPPAAALAALYQQSLVRMVVYQDKQTNGAQSQAEDLLSSGAASTSIFMSQNLANLGRFKVWKDKILKLDPYPSAGVAASYAQGGTIIPFKFSIKPNCYVNYNSTNGGTIADVIDNSFHFIAQSYSTDVVMTMVYKVRTVFTA